MGKSILIQFPSIMELVDFTLEVKTKDYKINRTHLTLVGNFTKEERALAKKKFKARVVVQE